MLSVLAHAGEPLQPHDAWWAWNLDPLVLLVMAGSVAAYVAGWRPTADTPGRRAAFAGAVGALVIALVSPVDVMSSTMVSAHMVQHVLLVLVAAPLLAVAAPGAAMLRGTPAIVREAARGARRTAGLDAGRLRRLRHPVARWLLYVVTLWLWHASVLYGAAVENEGVHVVEHVTFLGTAFLVWSAILGPERARVPRGLGLLGVFTLGLQGIFLSALITFAPEPWYSAYLVPPPGWGLDPLSDQQLAGVLMWVPAGFIHAGIALWLLARWLRESEEPEKPVGSSPVRAMDEMVIRLPNMTQ